CLCRVLRPILYLIYPRPPTPPLFPYTTLFRSAGAGDARHPLRAAAADAAEWLAVQLGLRLPAEVLRLVQRAGTERPRCRAQGPGPRYPRVGLPPADRGGAGPCRRRPLPPLPQPRRHPGAHAAGAEAAGRTHDGECLRCPATPSAPPPSPACCWPPPRRPGPATTCPPRAPA